ncbi:hypothetical protein SSAG_03097 [Streptomyces sp. Mg1]|nr:hypothetical protein SSAG_03097 [Streptomyces sp. Mg1]
MGCSVLSTRMEQTRMAPVRDHGPGDPAEYPKYAALSARS